MKLGILPLGRATFDVAFATEKLEGMVADLESSGHDIVGTRNLLTEPDTTTAALDDLIASGMDHLLILQVTFTDAAMTVAAATAVDCPVSIWAVPEPRLGGRLRLNAFCGLNLAAHALGLNGRPFTWVYADAGAMAASDLEVLFDGKSKAPGTSPTRRADTDENAGKAIVSALAGRKIGRIGAHPDGFDTCAYDAAALKALTGVSVEPMALDDLFAAARAQDPAALAALRTEAAQEIHGLAEVNADELDKSLRLRLALDDIRSKAALDAFAIRCWPETFTEYGGAVCGPVSMMGEARVPCACEADVYGAVTQMILQEAAQQPVFLADLVDMDVADDTGVVWHCGQAPRSMCAESVVPSATIHTNRRMPLLLEFALKPGRVTLVRLSQAKGETKLILSAGEMLDRPMAFTGTSGVIRFDRPAADVLSDVIETGLEHHMALAYGDHRPALRGVAEALGIPVLEI